MDFEKLLSATIRFSSFLGIRLIFFSTFAVLLLPWSGYEYVTGDIIKATFSNLQAISGEYEKLLEQFGLEGIAAYFLLFFTLVIIQLYFVIFSAIGGEIPPNFRHTKLELVEREMILKSLEKCRKEGLEYERMKRVVDSSEALHERVVEAWNLRNSTAQEVYSVSKGLLFFSSLAALYYFYQDFYRGISLPDSYYFFPVALLILSFFSGLYLKKSREGAHAELVKKLDAKLEAELFVAFAGVEYSRRPTVAEPRFDGNWDFRWHWFGLRRKT